VGAGVGFVRLEAAPDPVRVRAAYVSDDDIRAMAATYTAGLADIAGGEVA
jgi:S-DNA-T family DNA segregation ATPase FtsK/SpoIIIE